MKHSESLANIAAALSKAQAGVKVAVKDSANPHLKSRYASLGSVFEACREVLAENGLSVVQMPVTDEPGYIALDTMLLHISGEYIGDRARVRLQKDDPQGVGSALTYLRRYALSAALGIVADEDDDGNAASTGPQRGQQAARPAPTQPRPAQEADAPTTTTIGEEKASKVHKALGNLLKGTEWEGKHAEWVAEQVGRTVEHLRDLTPEENALLGVRANEFKAARLSA